MGTFHPNAPALHGMTVVVEREGSRVYVGRCEDVDDERVLLLDAGVHEPGNGTGTAQDFVQQAARYGVWSTLEVVAIPRREVISLKRLSEIEAL
jgi:hypothetical protein